MKIKTSELEGAALDWAVAIAIGCRAVASGYGLCWHSGDTKVSATNAWKPSTDWIQGGPLIEAYKLTLRTDEPSASFMQGGVCCGYMGRTVLIAACRAIVASKLGDAVDVPEGLV